MSISESESFGLRDIGILVALLALAAIPRLSGITELGLSQFDEGGYAVSALAVAEGAWPERQYPTQHYLAPPILFGVTGLVMKVCGTTTHTVLLSVVAIFGILTVLLVYLIGFVWNGRSAAVAAALMLALSGFHLTYSQIGLTDAVFLFFFLLALLFYSLSEKRKSMTLAVLAGVAMGLAWNTKYHGWLAGVIAAAALVPILVIGRKGEFRGGLLRFAVSVGVAWLMYAPWFIFVTEQPGGYAKLVSEHRNFLRHPRHIPAHVAVHAHAQLLLDGWAGRVAPMLALFGAALAKGDWRQRLPNALIWAPAVALAGLTTGQMGAAAILSLIGLVAVLRRPNHSVWIQLGFLGLFTALTPIYHPYIRLLLPWAAAVFITAGVGLDALVSPRSASAPRRFVAPLIATVVLFIAFVQLETIDPRPIKGRGSDGLERASEELAAILPPNARIEVMGEPGVIFHLRRAGFAAEHFNKPTHSLFGAPGEVVYVVRGHYGQFSDQLERLSEQNPGTVEKIATIRAEAGLVRLLNDYKPAEIDGLGDDAGQDLELFRISTPGK